MQFELRMAKKSSFEKLHSKKIFYERNNNFVSFGDKNEEIYFFCVLQQSCHWQVTVLHFLNRNMKEKNSVIKDS